MGRIVNKPRHGACDAQQCNISAGGHDDRRFQLLQPRKCCEWAVVATSKHILAAPRERDGQPPGIAADGIVVLSLAWQRAQAPQASDLRTILGGRDLEPRWNLRGSVHLEPAAREQGEQTYYAFKKAEQKDQGPAVCRRRSQRF